jgi:Flp pilus assembly protein TadB
MALDPKSAAKLGEAYGKGVTDAVFGIVDVVKNAPAQKAANNARVIQQNKITELNNQIIRNNNALREQAMREIAAEAEQHMLLQMTPAQRKVFKENQAAEEKRRARAEREAKERAEEFWQYFWAFMIIFVFVPLVVWIGLLIFGIVIKHSDYYTYKSLADVVPLLRTIGGR